MAIQQLEGIHFARESMSYIDALHAVLTHRGAFAESKPMLAGMTAMGFRFTVHRRLAAPSATAYNWLAEHFVAADLIGIASAQHAGFSFDPTFPLYRKHAVAAIKASIDRGAAAVFWKDAFVVASGYDDEAQTLFYLDGSGVQRLPYADFGRCESPYWYYQASESQVPLDPLEVYRESLMQAIHFWESHDALLPESEYACGEQAYDALIQALTDSAGFDPAEAAAVLETYAAAKRDIAAYAGRLAQLWPGCGGLAACYGEAASLFGEAAGTLAAGTLAAEGDAAAAVRAASLLREAQRHERDAIAHIKLFMRETVQNRFHDVALR
ncbi:hypothetical protein [Paenibacillus silvisoli]|uniref:hypothetical protein n=1 Tax=Paenibacillus silvisoli TaxID=3110539 RepID=UPI0028047140|nr:hypothetical protein [Paenibacillus silvisoli]